MRRLVVALMLATLTSAAFAADGRFATGSPSTVRNDDSCDLSNLPAATLLLPYFEVDFGSPQSTAVTTLFTITNVSNLPQIARVTLWTDGAFPGVTFNIFLTGYDVQAINLYDIFARGVIAPGGSSSGSTSSSTTPGPLSASNGGNPHFLPVTVSACSQLPGVIPASSLVELRQIFTIGKSSFCGSTVVGGVHASAIGYATMDVVATCSPNGPAQPIYYSSELLYDNVLMGDYQQINPNSATGNYAGGNPMVHIRAIPEGGNAGSAPGTNLPYTFYNRLLAPGTDRTRDRRQPLPSAFAARFIQGGTGGFNTNFKIWREATSGADPACGDYTKNRDMGVAEVVRFDEHENSFVLTYPCYTLCGPPTGPRLPAASSIATSSSLYPPMISSDVGGWMYINANNGGSLGYSAAAGRDFVTGSSTAVGSRQSQNWLIVSMSAEGRYSVDYDGLALGNGCSPAPATAFIPFGDTPTGVLIGPRPDANP